jgi:homoserine kinase type II
MRLDSWGLAEPVVAPIQGGFNSHTWDVRAGGERYVAKRVGGERASFEAGLRIAELLEERGFPAGGPVRTLSGELTVPCDGEWLALLRFVPGDPVTPETRDGLETWGQVMGRVHSLLADVPPPDGLAGGGGGGVDLDAPHFAVAAWVRPAVVAVTDEVGRITGLTHGIVHNDGCEPRRDATTGEISVIDWNAAGYGPLVGDVGAARYDFQSAGRPAEEFAPFLDAYRAEAPVDPSELAHVAAFVRLRAAMSGWYFAWRIHEGYVAGADDAWNRAGLEHARRMWEELAD